MATDLVATATKRGMGRGLAAILPEPAAGETELRELEVAEITPNPDQPRKRFDPEAISQLAESVAAAANEIYRARGYKTGYRTGRSIGLSYLEAPELKQGDRTILRAGMTFAVDGGISVDGVLGGRIGDSIVVTESGFDYLTDYPREIMLAGG